MRRNGVHQNTYKQKQKSRVFGFIKLQKHTKNKMYKIENKYHTKKQIKHTKNTNLQNGIIRNSNINTK